MRAEIALEFGIERDVALVITEQIQLHLIGTRARQIEVVERLTIRGNRRLIGHAVGVLPTRRFRREQRAERVPVGFRGVLPVSADGIPAVAQALHIGVAVLGNDRGDTLRMFRCDPESGRRTIIEDIDREAVEADDLGEPVDHARDVVERIVEFVPSRHVRLPEAGQVGRDDVEAVGQQRDQVPEHVARAGETVQQQQRERVGGSGFPVKELKPVDVDGSKSDGTHNVLLQSPHRSLLFAHTAERELVLTSQEV